MLSRLPTAGGPARTAGVNTGSRARVLLITGMELTASSTGAAPVATVVPGESLGPLISMRSAGQAMVAPADALPYLGRGLDPRLFQLSALEKAERHGRLPVRITFTGHQPSVPGVTVTRAAAGTAWGYLTAASAGRFGTALARQFGTDHPAARYGSDGLFGHRLRIWLGGPLPAPTHRPAAGGKRYTLTVTGTNLAGKQDNGDLVEVDNVDTFRVGGTRAFHNGTATFRVPAGHYWAVGIFVDRGMRLAVLPQFTVAGDATVHMAETSASAKFTMTVPRPAAPAVETVQLARTAAHGGGGVALDAVFFNGMGQGWVSPLTSRPTAGKLYFTATATLTSPRHTHPSYGYNLDFTAPEGVIPRPDYHVTAARLGTVTERFYQDVPSRGQVLFTGTNLTQLANGLGGTVGLGAAMPQAQTQYFSAGHGIMWLAQACTSVPPPPLPPLVCYGGDTDRWRSYTGGQHLTENWNNYPLHPAPDTTLGGPATVFPVQSSADRAGNTLFLNWTPFSDNQFGHVGAGFLFNGNANVTGRYAVYQNGTRTARGSALLGIPPITLRAKPATLRFVLTAARRSGIYRLSPASRTVWTWHSAPGPGATLPAGWYCANTTTGPIERCTVQPLMTLDYHVAGMSLRGLTQPGPQAITLTAGHIQLAPAAAITGATAQVSFNSGHTWRAAAVAPRGHGKFRITFTAPPGVTVTTRVSATDASGGAITETIQNGYGISS
jgi:hypothetical protein